MSEVAPEYMWGPVTVEQAVRDAYMDALIDGRPRVVPVGNGLEVKVGWE